jgi:hypothetical protein
LDEAISEQYPNCCRLAREKFEADLFSLLGELNGDESRLSGKRPPDAKKKLPPL